jgi:hypothetical protein
MMMRAYSLAAAWCTLRGEPDTAVRSIPLG